MRLAPVAIMIGDKLYKTFAYVPSDGFISEASMRAMFPVLAAMPAGTPYIQL